MHRKGLFCPTSLQRQDQYEPHQQVHARTQTHTCTYKTPLPAAATFEVSLAHPKLAPLASLGVAGAAKLLLPCTALIAMASAAVRAMGAPAATPTTMTNGHSPHPLSAIFTAGVLSAPHLLSRATYVQLGLTCSVDAADGSLCVRGHAPAWRKPRSMLQCAAAQVGGSGAGKSHNAGQQPGAALAVLAEPACWVVQQGAHGGRRSSGHNISVAGFSGQGCFAMTSRPSVAGAGGDNMGEEALHGATEIEPEVAQCCKAEAELALQVRRRTRGLGCEIV